jgi:hypothetical protein
MLLLEIEIYVLTVQEQCLNFVDRNNYFVEELTGMCNVQVA